MAVSKKKSGFDLLLFVYDSLIMFRVKVYYRFVRLLLDRMEYVMIVLYH